MSEPWMTDGEIASSYRNSINPAEHPDILAAINDCPVSVIRKILISRGIDPVCAPPRKARRGQADYEAVKKFYAAGYSDAEIARRAGCSRSTVTLWRTRNKLAPGGRGQIDDQHTYAKSGQKNGGEKHEKGPDRDG